MRIRHMFNGNVLNTALRRTFLPVDELQCTDDSLIAAYDQECNHFLLM